jgi:hypothetical protein
MTASTEPERVEHARHVRWLFLVLGLLCVGAGVLGIFLPVLPTTPFMLLAAACFARSSDRFYHWLLNHAVFGSTVREWREHRSIPLRSKWVAILTMAVTLAISIIFFIPRGPLQWVLVLLGITLAVYLYRIPSRQ